MCVCVCVSEGVCVCVSEGVCVCVSEGVCMCVIFPLSITLKICTGSH